MKAWKSFGRLSRRLLFPAIALSAFANAGAYGQLLSSRPFLEGSNGGPSASLVGPRCAQEVNFIFTSKQSGSFNQDGVATRLMSNVVSMIRRSCPQAKLVAAKGTVDSQLVYNAVADSDSDWILLQLGSSRDNNLLGGSGRGTSADRSNFLRRKDFTPFGAFLAGLKGKQYLCSGAQNGSCSALSEFRGANEDGATVVARSLLDSRGTVAVLTYASVNRNGLLCSNPGAAKIDVVGGAASPAARARMATDLRERLKPYGDQVCSGYAARGGQVISANFDGGGARIGQEAVLLPSANPFDLRQER